MPAENRIRSAKDALGDLRIGDYRLFQGATERKYVAIWQPTGEVNGLHELPTPEPEIEQKAASFLNSATDGLCDLAVAPEWAFNLHWVQHHVDQLYADNAPLFVLGCSPIAHEDLQAVLGALNEEILCLQADEPSAEATRFVTPTIIPLRIQVEEGGTDPERALLIQYKNQPMGDRANWNERANMARGRKVWKVDPEDHRTRLLALNCSDLIDVELRDQAKLFARDHRSIIVHVQCNPKPFDNAWTRFREELFDGQGYETAYLSANWSWIVGDGHEIPMGYSGVYAKAPRGTPLSKYSATYLRGGLPAANPESRFEYLWNLSEDCISKVAFFLPSSQGDGHAAASFCDLNVIDLKAWADGSYVDSTSRVPECTSPECSQWLDSLPGDPLTQELIAAVAMGMIDLNDLTRRPTDPFRPEDKVKWSTIKTLRGTNRERTRHSVAAHGWRDGRDTADICADLNAAFAAGSDEGPLVPNPNLGVSELPKNALLEVKDQEVALTLVEGGSTEAFRRRRDWIAFWLLLRDRPFKIFIAQNPHHGPMEVVEGPRHEHVDGSPSDPRSVDVSGGPGERFE